MQKLKNSSQVVNSREMFECNNPVMNLNFLLLLFILFIAINYIYSTSKMCDFLLLASFNGIFVSPGTMCVDETSLIIMLILTVNINC